jgi:hypothetical protein
MFQPSTSPTTSCTSHAYNQRSTSPGIPRVLVVQRGGTEYEYSGDQAIIVLQVGHWDPRPRGWASGFGGAELHLPCSSVPFSPTATDARPNLATVSLTSVPVLGSMDGDTSERLAIEPSRQRKECGSPPQRNPRKNLVRGQHGCAHCQPACNLCTYLWLSDTRGRAARWARTSRTQSAFLERNQGPTPPPPHHSLERTAHARPGAFIEEGLTHRTPHAHSRQDKQTIINIMTNPEYLRGDDQLTGRLWGTSTRQACC